jgi:hypothetical protein
MERLQAFQTAARQGRKRRNVSSWEVGLFWLEKWNTLPKPLLRCWTLTIADFTQHREVRVESFSPKSIIFIEEKSKNVATLELKDAEFSYGDTDDEDVPAPEELKLGFRCFLRIEFPLPDGRLYVIGELSS